MRTYKRLVARHKRALQTAGLLKTASDIASLLDDPIFGYPTGEKIDNWTIQHVAETREGMFHILSSAFASASVPLPPLEPQFYESVLAEKAGDEEIAETERISKHVSVQTGKGKETLGTALCDTLCLALRAFPKCCNRFSGITKRQLVAKLNQQLLADGREPVRPDYASLKKNGVGSMPVPARNVNLVIVDDSTEDAAKTLKALVGWKNITLIPYHHARPEYSGEKLAKEVRMKAVAERVLALNPDVIVMDQGLDNDFKGSELISVIRALAPRSPVFIANTGGEDEELRNAGAFPNCNKGEKLGPVAQAIESLGSQA